MNHIAFMEYIRKAALKEPGFAPETRVYKTAAGCDVLIHLPMSYWFNVDWLEERGEIDFAAWVKDCDLNPTEGSSLPSDLMYWLWQDECERHRKGLPTPTDLPPEGFVPDGVVANDI